MQGLKSFRTAKKILSGMKEMHLLRKKKIFLREKFVKNQNELIHQLFGLTA